MSNEKKDEKVEKKDPKVEPKEEVSGKKDSKESKGGKNKRRNGNKGRKPKDQGNPREVNPDKKEAPGNDFAWYSKNPKVLEATSNLFFNTLYGYDLKSLNFTPATGMSQLGTGNEAVPGVVVAEFIPWVGAKGTESDPINIASQNLYTWLRHANSGSVNYERSDLIQYLLAVASMYVAVESLKRDLRLVSTYSPVNKYVFTTLLDTMGYSASGINGLRANIANNIGQLNILIAKLSSLVLPNDLPFMSRWKWLVSNVFRDDELEKASYYAFKMTHYWVYDWANAKCVLTAHGGNDFPTRLNAIESALNALLGNSDIGTITGDILKAYKAENCEKITTMSLGEVLQPTFDMDAVNQFRNATIVGRNAGETYELKQVNANTQLLHTTNTRDSNVGRYYGYATSISNTEVASPIVVAPRLTLSSNNPSVQEIVEQSRFACTLKSAIISNAHLFYTDNAATEIITNVIVGRFTGSSFVRQSLTCTVTSIDALDAAEATNFLTITNALHMVSGTPTYYSLTIESGSGIQVTSYTSGKNIQVVEEVAITNINAACVLSEWTMPMFKMLETN